MAKQEEKPSLYEKVRTFLEEVRSEMSKVAWPSKDEIKSSTSVVLMLLVLLAVIIGGMDFLFRTVVVTLLKLA